MNNNAAIQNWYKFIVLHKKIVILLVILLGSAWYLATHAIIGVTIEHTGAQQDQETLITLTAENGKTITTKTKNKSVWKIVRAGRYEISATTEDHSAWTTQATSRFLKKSTVKLTLLEETDREFVGNNPSSCVNTESGLLISYDCGGAIERLKIHTPATSTTPTYAQGIVSPPSGVVVGIIQDAQQTKLVALVGDDDPAPVIFDLDVASGKLTKSQEIHELPNNTYISMIKYDEGYLLYTEDYSKAAYYHGGSIEKLTLDDSNAASELHPTKIAASGSSLVRVLSKKTESTVDPPHNHTTEGNDIILITTNGNTREFSTRLSIVSALPCGTDKICVLVPMDEKNNQLLVYDISGRELRELYRVTKLSDVKKAEESNIGLIKDDGVWLLDVNEGTAYRTYSTNDSYSTCGLSEDSKYICVRSGQQSSGLLLGHGDKVIDRQIVALAKYSDIERVSAYKNFIYVTPGLELHHTASGFDYYPEEKREADAAIKEHVQEVGIDTSRYEIINLRK